MRDFIILGLLVLICGGASAQTWDVKSDTWVASDALGRSLPGYAECGPPRSDKTVGIFYFLWFGQHGTDGPYDNTKILAANSTNPQWGPHPAFHHWGEPELGYYLSDDEHVIRRHCQMFVDAGVDVLFFDVSNGWPYTSNYMLLCSVYRQIRNEGGKTPQICFMGWWNRDTVKWIYDDLYSKNLYSELWFRWQGKPLILGQRDAPMQDGSQLPQHIKDFFTWRECWFDPAGYTAGYHKWTFGTWTPQNYGWDISGVPEQTSVSAAQSFCGTRGRSWHNGIQPPHNQYYLCSETAQGSYFAEQMQLGLQVDPQLLFITGWNEWAALHLLWPQDFLDPQGNPTITTFLGVPLQNGDSVFVDNFNQEYSRDIEPMKGGHTDNYYYQMIDGIRRYKGVRAPETPSPVKTIALDGDFSDWSDVGPEYRDTIYDTTHRNHSGWGSAGTYTNTTGRNDIKIAKVARDSNYIYFYVETVAGLSVRSDPNWMLLFIDSDQNPSTGWHGYDYLVNSSIVHSTSTTLKKNTGGWNWTNLPSVSYRAIGNKMEIAVPRSAIGQSGGSGASFDFHWADNIQQNGDITQFFTSGDSAPDRRFNYRYSTAPSGVTSFAASPGDTQNRLSWTNPPDKSFSSTMIRYRTDTYPTSPTNGILVCDRVGSPGSTDTYWHKGLADRTYYYSAFAHDLVPNYSQGAAASAMPAVSACFSEPFSYPNGPLNGRGGWTGSASSQIEVTAGTLKISGGATSYDASRILSCGGQNGTIWVHVKMKVGIGSNTMWSLWIDDPAGRNLARWYGSGTTARGRIGAGSQVTSVQNLTGSWDDLHVILYAGSNQSEFYFNGVLIGTLSHAETGAGDTIGRVRFERIDNSAAANDYVYLDDLAAGYPDVIPPSATIAYPPGGVYTLGKSVTLTASEVGNIYFATDGTEPAIASSVYVSPIPLNTSMTLRFFAVDAAGNAESPKRQEAYTVLAQDGSIAAAKALPDDAAVALGGKVLYFKQGSFGYIEEIDRTCGIRVEGNVTASADQTVNLTGIRKTTASGEKCILVDRMTADGVGAVKPLGANNRDLRGSLMDGMLVNAWGMVKAGSLTSNSFVITDGSDGPGIKVITAGAPGVSEGAFAILTGASGFDGERVLYRKP